MCASIYCFQSTSCVWINITNTVKFLHCEHHWDRRKSFTITGRSLPRGGKHIKTKSDFLNFFNPFYYFIRYILLHSVLYYYLISIFLLMMFDTAPRDRWNLSFSSQWDKPRSFSLMRFIFCSRSSSWRNVIANTKP